VCKNVDKARPKLSIDIDSLKSSFVFHKSKSTAKLDVHLAFLFLFRRQYYHHRLSMAPKGDLRSIKAGLTFSTNCITNGLPTFMISTFSRPILNTQKSSIGSIIATKQGRNISNSSVASISRHITSLGDFAEAKRQCLPRDAGFDARVKQLHEEFNSAEQAFALNLSLKDRHGLSLPGHSSSFIASNFSFQMEILSTLESIKPCVLFHAMKAGSRQDTNPIFDRLVETELLPLYKAYGLDRHGFILSKVLHDLHIMETGENLRNCWVFADSRSEAWKRGAIQSVFFAPHDQHCLLSAAGDALGYPALPTITGYDRRYIYIDATATRELTQRTGARVEPVIGLEYLASDDRYQVQESREDFERYRKVGLKYGREYTFYSEPNPCLVDLQDYEWHE
jgi:hypothetical protein